MCPVSLSGRCGSVFTFQSCMICRFSVFIAEFDIHFGVTYFFESIKQNLTTSVFTTFTE